MRMTVTPGGAGKSSHAGTTTRSRSIHDGPAWARQVSVTEGSSSMTLPAPSGRERLGGARDRGRVVAEGGPQLDHVVRQPACAASLLDGRHSERPQRVGGQLGFAGRHGEHEPQHGACLADPGPALPVGGPRAYGASASRRGASRFVSHVQQDRRRAHERAPGRHVDVARRRGSGAQGRGRVIRAARWRQGGRRVQGRGHDRPRRHRDPLRRARPDGPEGTRTSRDPGRRRVPGRHHEPRGAPGRWRSQPW